MRFFCQLCQSAFFKMNVSPGKFTQLNESRSAVPAGCLLPALPSPLSADVWGGGEAQAVVAHLLISHLLYSEVSWQDRFDLDQAQTHFCWISPSTWCDALQLWVSWPHYVNLKLTLCSGLAKRFPGSRDATKLSNAFEPGGEFVPDQEFPSQGSSSFDPLLGTLNPGVSACESSL